MPKRGSNPEPAPAWQGDPGSAGAAAKGGNRGASRGLVAIYGAPMAPLKAKKALISRRVSHPGTGKAWSTVMACTRCNSFLAGRVSGSGLRQINSEGAGFEPARACTLSAFRTAAFVHSATPP